MNQLTFKADNVDVDYLYHQKIIKQKVVELEVQL